MTDRLHAARRTVYDKAMAPRFRLASAVGFLFFVAGAAAAQPPAEVQAPRIVENCATDDSEEIVVCGKRNPDAPYRLPPGDKGFDPWGEVESVSRERNRLLGPLTAGSGTCSTVGPGGWTGCDVEVIKRAEQQGKRVGIGSGGVDIGLQVGRKRAATTFP